MSRIVAFKADDDEQAEIEAYMKARHSKSLPELARLAFFAYMRQNKPGGHRTTNSSSNGDGLHHEGAGASRPDSGLDVQP